jgi:hypothetical protein
MNRAILAHQASLASYLQINRKSIAISPVLLPQPPGPTPHLEMLSKSWPRPAVRFLPDKRDAVIAVVLRRLKWTSTWQRLRAHGHGSRTMGPMEEGLRKRVPAQGGQFSKVKPWWCGGG